MTAVFPYRTLDGELDLRLDSLHIDGDSRPERMEQHLRRIDLSAKRDSSWRWLTADVEVFAPSGEIAEFLDDDTTPSVVLVVACPSTNLRTALPLVQSTAVEDAWTGPLTLFADDLRDKVSIYAELVADLNGRPARRLATSESWNLYVDPAAVPPFEGTFKVIWSHFAEDPSIPDTASSESFFIDLGGSIPVVHLNYDMDGLQELLQGADDRPLLELALRDAEMRRIATAAWTSAVGASAAAIRVDSETDEHELPEKGWMADILRWSLPGIYPGVPTDEAVRRIRQDLVGHGAAITEAMIQLTVSRHMEAGKLLQKTLKANEVGT